MHKGSSCIADTSFVSRYSKILYQRISFNTVWKNVKLTELCVLLENLFWWVLRTLHFRMQIQHWNMLTLIVNSSIKKCLTRLIICFLYCDRSFRITSNLFKTSDSCLLATLQKDKMSWIKMWPSINNLPRKGHHTLHLRWHARNSIQLRIGNLSHHSNKGND